MRFLVITSIAGKSRAVIRRTPRTGAANSGTDVQIPMMGTGRVNPEMVPGGMIVIIPVHVSSMLP